jgi:hypothetical protein
MAALVNILACSTATDLEDGLRLWLAGKEPGEMVNCYNLVWQLVLLTRQFSGEGDGR